MPHPHDETTRYPLPMRILHLCFLVLAACSHPDERAHSSTPAATVVTHTVRGVVRRVDAAKQIITISHEDIPGYMKAMTMPFLARSASLLRDLQPNDKIEFTFSDNGEGDIFIESIRKVP